jgi:Flp pilus assembly CpaF family ATPase
VEQIDVNGPDQVWVHYADQRGKVAVPPIADTDSQVTELVRRICAHAEAPRDFSDAHPLVHVSLGVGVRLAATMSVSPTTHISIRRHRLLDVSLPDLVSRDMLSPAAAEFLTAAVRARLDILVTGGQGVGKTTLLRALTAATDPDERIVTLESERELYLERIGRHRDVVALQAREPNQEGVGGVSVDDLFPTALRLHGNRIIVGEVRHTEMLSLLQACDSGAEGTLSTLHANSGREVFGRIVTLCAYSPNAPSAEDVFRLIGRAIDLVIHLRRDPSTGARYLSEVMEVLPPAETVEPATNRIFVPGPDGRAIVNPHGFAPTWISDLESAGFDPMLLDPRSGPKSTRTSGLDGMWAFNDTRG